MAKVILINPPPRSAGGINDATVSPPLGLAYLAAVLEKKGHNVQVIDAHIGALSTGSITSHFAFTPDLIGISSNIITYKGAIECARACKARYPGAPVVFGGPYPSSLKGRVLEENPDVDCVAIGEGENTVLEIAGALGLKDMFAQIKGVVYRKDGLAIENSPRPLIGNIDDIPPPAFHLLPGLEKYRTRSRAKPVGFLLSSRGCPYQCTFCNRNIFGSSWRPHSSARVLEDIRYLVRKYGIKQVDILDDNFTFDRKRAEEILDGLILAPGKIHINLQNGVRIDKTDEELLRKMKNAGVFKIGFGVETANREVQKNVKKYIDLDKAVSLTKAARSMGMVTVGFFIIGLPGDNSSTMEELIGFIRRMDPHIVNMAICIPFPGTELYSQVKADGVLYEDVDHGIESGFFGNTVYFSTGAADRQVVAEYFNRAYKEFYMRPAKAFDILGTIGSMDELRWLINAAWDMLLRKVRRPA